MNGFNYRCQYCDRTYKFIEDLQYCKRAHDQMNEYQKHKTENVDRLKKEKRERRERIAAQVLAGFVSNQFMDSSEQSGDFAIKYSVELADALIKELDK